jgi:hypothetical protein
MIDPDFSWADLKRKASYVASDSMVRFRTADNTLAWLPVYLNEASGTCYVRRYGNWRAVDSIEGFEGYERIKTKMLLDTATLHRVPAGG